MTATPNPLRASGIPGYENIASLADHFDEVRKTYIPEGGLTTLIYCGKIKSENERDKVTEMYMNLIDGEMKDNKEKITGYLMFQGNCVVNVMEGESHAILRIVNDARNHEHFTNKANIIQSGRIVYNAEDRPKRFFTSYDTFTINEKKVQVDELNSETSKDIVHEMATVLLEVGDIKSQSEESSDDKFDYKSIDSLPGKSLILALADCPLFFTIDDFAQYYTGWFPVKLESYEVWPLQKSLGPFSSYP